YKYEFELPEEWRGKQIELVFEAAMTDTDVLINGRKAGKKHQGGFYRFIYDVSDRVFFGPGKKNRLEVTVAKESENAGVNLAERRADYWNFGGLWRPVFMQARPALNLKHLAIDAKADGAFKANYTLSMPVENGKITTVIFDKNGKKVAETVTPIRKGAGDGIIELDVKSPATWSAETPELYKAEFTLSNADGKVLHKETKKFGFRTIEVRESDGLYINGQKVNIRGVNRHSFRPESGRTLSFEKNLEDVKLIKSMNMNAVRLSHYPADPEFYEICDSLGLYVMDELTGWHGKHETINGRKLVQEMVERDVNHPSIIWWSNGNEKGWNDELNDEFHKYDPQKRPVLHPQGNFGGFETMHYRSYGESQDYMRLPEIFMPTEFLHGLYDGGHGAGLYDYWEMMRNNPKCAGGFLWVLADEGVKRVDMDGFIDNCGNYGADGIVGPHHEKEGSYWTIKEVWCPIQILNTSIPADFDGKLNVENRYDFTNLKDCTIKWRQIDLPESGDQSGVRVVAEGTVKLPDIPVKSAGTVNIPALRPAADALELTVVDNYGNDLFTWSHKVEGKAAETASNAKGSAPVISETADILSVSANGRTYNFSRTDGMLTGVDVNGKRIGLANGPRVIVAKRSDRSMDGFYNHDDKEAEKKKTQYTEFEDLGKFVGIEAEKEGDNVVVTADYKLGNFDQARWTIAPDGSADLDFTYSFDGVIDLLGVKFDFPEEKVLGKRWVGDGPYRVWQNRLHGPQYGLWENDYNDPIPAESFTYPEFKGYFANVDWMDINTADGVISITNETPGSYIGVYEPRDGRDHILYELPKTGISVMEVIPPVRNKVNTTDLIGPSSQPKWVAGQRSGRIHLNFK
ncbi:MAG: glycoside hydrolase family 2, partial [Muribaculaceae bacterium]|nr:glycoside hydrolase family 2 [Muribaculaceae bacterium]